MADLLTFRENIRAEELTKIRETLLEPDMEDAFILFFDGAFRKATHSAVGGFVIKDPKGETVHTEGIVLSNANTNNEAEYATLWNV